MEVILTNDVVGLGDIGETVSVKPGYGRNYLIPQGFAIETGSANARQIQHHMRSIEAKKKHLQSEAEDKAKSLLSKRVVVHLRVGKSGRVFGSVNRKAIAEALAKEGFEIDRRRVQLSEPIKELGIHQVEVKLHQGITPTIPVHVEATEATKEEQEQEKRDAAMALMVEEAEQRAAETAEGEAQTQEEPGSEEVADSQQDTRSQEESDTEDGEESEKTEE